MKFMATPKPKKLAISIPPEWSRVAQQFAKDVEAFVNTNAATVAAAPTTDNLAALESQINALQSAVTTLQAEIDALSGGGIQLTALQPIAAFTAVYEAVKGGAKLADSATVVTKNAIVGLSKTAASVGTKFFVARSGETVSNSIWSFAVGPVYVGTAGVLTQTVPAVGFREPIGYAVDTTTVLVAVGSPMLVQQNSDGTSDAVQVQGLAVPEGSLDVGTWGDESSSGAPVLRGMRSRGGAVGTQGALLMGDSMLDIVGDGSDGSAMFRAGRISLVTRDDTEGTGLVAGQWNAYVTDESGEEQLASELFWFEGSGPFDPRARLYLSGTDLDPDAFKSASIFATGGAFGMSSAAVFFGGNAIIVGGTDADIDLRINAKGNGAVIPSLLALTQITTPAVDPGAGFLDVYPKSDDNVYTLNSAGLEQQIAYVGDVSTEFPIQGDGSPGDPVRLVFDPATLESGSNGLTVIGSGADWTARAMAYYMRARA